MQPMGILAPIQAALLTDRGIVRDHNEDYVLYWEPDTVQDEAKNGWLYIVADGVGGADAGEVASEFASERTQLHYLENGTETHLGERLRQAMHAANTDLRQLVTERDGAKRMATTMVALAIQDRTAYISNVEDSRGYHWRTGVIRQVTKDQSLVAKLVEEGAITEEEARHHPHKNVILYSIGSEKIPQIDIYDFTIESGDKILLCSDGLTRHVTDAELSVIIAQPDLQAAVDEMIKKAKDRGGYDNITAVIIEYGNGAAEADNVDRQDTTKVIMPKAEPKTRSVKPNRAFLLPYTLFLGVIQIILTVLIWYLLRA